MALTPESVRRRATATGSDTHYRSREVISPSGGIMRCKFPSRKNARLVHCEGLLELDAAYAFELHPGIAHHQAHVEILGGVLKQRAYIGQRGH